MARHVLARTLHDVGLAIWFGGSLMGSVGLNGAAASLRNPDERSAAATTGWSRWAPLNAVAVGAHLVGATQLLRTEGYRVRRQQGVARSSAIKTGLTVAAIGTTAYSGVLNRRMVAAGNVPVQGATEPGAGTPPEVAATQKQLKAIQWLIPGLTGALVGVTAWQSEQMRPSQIFAGSIGGSLRPVTSSGKPIAVAAGAALLLGLRRKRKASKASKGTDYTTSSSTYGTSSSTAPSPLPPVSPYASGSPSTTVPTAPISAYPSDSAESVDLTRTESGSSLGDVRRT